MKRYIKSNQETSDNIVVLYRNKVIYDGSASVDPIEIFKGIRNFNPNENYADKYLIESFERNKEDILDYWGTPLHVSYRNGRVKIYSKEKFNPESIATKEKPDPNTAVVDGERLTAEEIADDVMLEADNYEYVYNTYQSMLSDYAKKVIEKDWEGTDYDKVPFSVVRYVVNSYKNSHSVRKQTLTSMCYPFIAPQMQEDYDRYKAEYSNSEVE